jgi:hypothetical protein
MYFAHAAVARARRNAAMFLAEEKFLLHSALKQGRKNKQ